MTALQLEKPWDEVKELLKEVNGNLTDEDLAYEPGQEEQLFSRLEKKVDMRRDDIKGWIESVSFNEGKAS